MADSVRAEGAVRITARFAYQRRRRRGGRPAAPGLEIVQRIGAADAPGVAPELDAPGGAVDPDLD